MLYSCRLGLSSRLSSCLGAGCLLGFSVFVPVAVRPPPLAWPKGLEAACALLLSLSCSIALRAPVRSQTPGSGVSGPG
jgi:hypothetical protein